MGSSGADTEDPLTGIPAAPELARLAAEAEQLGFELLVLFGSRARGDCHAHSDWDFAVLGQTPATLSILRAKFTELLGSEQVDVIDLHRAGGLIRHRVASEGRVLFENPVGRFVEFQLAATQFWCDVEPVIRRAHAQVLDQLKAT